MYHPVPYNVLLYTMMYHPVPFNVSLHYNDAVCTICGMHYNLYDGAVISINVIVHITARYIVSSVIFIKTAAPVLT